LAVLSLSALRSRVCLNPFLKLFLHLRSRQGKAFLFDSPLKTYSEIILPQCAQLMALYSMFVFTFRQVKRKIRFLRAKSEARRGNSYPWLHLGLSQHDFGGTRIFCFVKYSLAL
jgi:hypothetical protein